MKSSFKYIITGFAILFMIVFTANVNAQLACNGALYTASDSYELQTEEEEDIPLSIIAGPGGATSAQIIVCFAGDIDSSGEEWFLEDESGTTTVVFDGTYPQSCDLRCEIFPISIANLATWGADGMIDFTADFTGDDFAGCPQVLSVELQYCLPDFADICTDNIFTDSDSYVITQDDEQDIPLSISAGPGGASIAQITVCYAGDIDSNSELWVLTDESGTATTVFGGTSPQNCDLRCETLPISTSDLATWSADGMINFEADFSGDQGACPDELSVMLTYCYQAESVPTIGQWGLIILGLGFLAFGIAFAYGRSKVYA